MLWWLAQNTFVAGLLTGLVALLCRLGRLGPAARHALWLAVLVKLVTPPVIEWPWALPDIGPARPNECLAAVDGATVFEDGLPAQVELQTILRTHNPAPGEAPPLRPRAVADQALELSISDPAQSVAWLHVGWLASVVYNLWLAGTVILCLLQVYRIARFRRLLARADPAPRWLEDLVAEVAGTLRVRRPLTLIAPGVGSPFVWSLGRPKLLWPAPLLERLPRDGQRSIAAHELAHLRRRDHWVGWLQLVAECGWWWNPLFWYVRRQLRLNAELACDAWVVSTLPEDRRVYAEALIEVTQLLSQTAAPLPALGMSGAARQDFERRLIMIMRDRVPCRVPAVGLLAIGALALISLPGWSQVQVQVHKVQDVEKTPAPEKPIILNLEASTDVVQDVQKLDGEKKVLLFKDGPAAAPDRERRLQKLEEQLQELLKEVQALRSGSAKREAIFGYKVSPDMKPGEPIDRPRVRIIEHKPSDVKQGQPSTSGPEAKRTFGYWVEQVDNVKGMAKELIDGKEVVSSITLSRATYKLPHGQAEALANFLAHHSRVQVLETKVDGDNLIVTTTQEAQAAIREFLSLIEGTTAPKFINMKK